MLKLVLIFLKLSDNKIFTMFFKNDLCLLKLLFLIFTYVLNFFNCSKPNAAPISEGSKLYPAPLKI